MSEKGPFDAAINELHGVMGEAEETGIWDDLIGECKAAIRVLEDWPKWEPLIEAAGKVDKKTCLDEIDDCYYSKSLNPWGTEARILGEIRALLESLPGKEEK